VQNAQNPHGATEEAIGGDVRSANDQQLPRSLDAASAAHLGELLQALDLAADALIYRDGGSWVVCFDEVEDRVAVSLREEGPLHAYSLTLHGLSSLAKGGGSSLCEVGFNLLVRDAGAWIVERFVHLVAEPDIVRDGVRGQCER